MAKRAMAIETSGREGSVSAAIDGEAVVSERFAHGLQHAAGLVPMLARVIAQAGWSDADVEELYLSAGPGSFTGLRIGMTLARSWAFVRGTPVVAVPSLRVIVENLPGEARHAAVVLDAKRGQVFTASYSREGGRWVQRREPRLDTLARVVAGDPRPLVLVGEGLGYHRLEAVPEGVTLAGEELWPARSQRLARLGYELARQGRFADPASLTPIYVRLPEAEEKWRLERGLPL